MLDDAQLTHTIKFLCIQTNRNFKHSCPRLVRKSKGSLDIADIFGRVKRHCKHNKREPFASERDARDSPRAREVVLMHSPASRYIVRRRYQIELPR